VGGLGFLFSVLEENFAQEKNKEGTTLELKINIRPCKTAVY
jgi:hypothetical protein